MLIGNVKPPIGLTQITVPMSWSRFPQPMLMLGFHDMSWVSVTSLAMAEMILRQVSPSRTLYLVCRKISHI